MKETIRAAIATAAMILSGVAAEGQSLGRVFDLYAEGQIDSAYAEIEVVSKKLATTGEERTALSMAYGLLYSDERFAKSDDKKAIKQLKKVEKSYPKMKQTERKWMEGYGIKEDSATNMLCQIAMRGLWEAKRLDTPASYDEYQKTYGGVCKACDDSVGVLRLVRREKDDRYYYEIVRRNDNEKEQKAYYIAVTQDGDSVARKYQEELGGHAEDRFELLRPYGRHQSIYADSVRVLLEDTAAIMRKYYQTGRLENMETFRTRFPEYRKAHEGKDSTDYYWAGRLMADSTLQQGTEEQKLEYVRHAAPSDLALKVLLSVVAKKYDKPKDRIKMIESYRGLFGGYEKEIDMTIGLLKAQEGCKVTARALSGQVNDHISNSLWPQVRADNKKLNFFHKEFVPVKLLCRKPHAEHRWENGVDIDNETEHHNMGRVSSSEYRQASDPREGSDWTKRKYDTVQGLGHIGISSVFRGTRFEGIKDQPVSYYSADECVSAVEGTHAHGDKMATQDGGIVRVTDVATSAITWDYYKQGNTDLFWEFVDGEGRTSHINLGPTINSRFNETQGVMADDCKTLYFLSDRLGGMGSYDLYMSRRLNDSTLTEWSEPVNLGPTINTMEDEQPISIAADGKTIYFSRYVKTYGEWNGHFEVFCDTLPEEFRAEPRIVVKGRVVCNPTGNIKMPVESEIRFGYATMVEVAGKPGEYVEGTDVLVTCTAAEKRGGEFIMSLPTDRKLRIEIVPKRGKKFKSQVIEIDPRESWGEVEKEVVVEMVKKSRSRR